MESDQRTRATALIVAITASFITPFIGSAINVALPAIGRSFEVDAVMLSWVATAYLLSTGVSLVPAGRLADIYGRKRMMRWGFAVFALTSALCALSVSIEMLIVARIIQGFGSGMIFATGLAILVSVFPPQERGKVLGITVSSVYIGLSSGPFIGGVLTEHLDWHSLFWLVLLMSLVVIAMLSWGLKGEWAESKGEKMDIIGSLVYGVMLVSLIYGLSLLPSAHSLWIIAIGLVGLVVFVWWEHRVTYPVFALALFRSNRTFAFSNLAALIHYSATFGITFLMSLYLQYVKGLSPQVAGLVLIAQPVTMALVSPLSGRLSDRLEPRYIASTGMLITAVMLMLLSRLNGSTDLVQIVGYLIVLGLGFALFSSPNMNAIMSSVEKRHLGTASGISGTMRVLGQIVSMGIATLVITAFVGRVKITAEVHANLVQATGWAFMIFAGLCLIGLYASLTRGDVRSAAARRSASSS
jgi:EmrB/QacA subfamily drug resistance transporter